MPTTSLPTTDRQLFTRPELEGRLSKKTLNTITDDDKSGSGDRRVIEQIIRDASAMVWSYLPTFELADADPIPDYLKKIALDVGQGIAYTRFPQTLLGQVGFELLDRAQRDLKNLSTGANAIPPAGGGAGSGTGGDGAGSTTATQGRGAIRSAPRRAGTGHW